MSEEWLAVDTSSLEEFGIKGHNFLYQLARSNKLTPQQVQDSIFYFAFDLKRNDKARKIKGDKIMYLLGPLK